MTITPREYYETIIKADGRFGTKETQHDIQLLIPQVQRAAYNFLKLCEEEGKEVHIIETLRSKERQHELFLAGTSKLDHIGTHYFAIAWDVAYFIAGEYQKDQEAYDFMPRLCKKVGMISGHDWGHGKRVKGKWYDSPHCQLIQVANQNSLFSGKWFPKADYNPYGGEMIEEFTEEVWKGVPYA